MDNCVLSIFTFQFVWRYQSMHIYAWSSEISFRKKRKKKVQIGSRNWKTKILYYFISATIRNFWHWAAYWSRSLLPLIAEAEISCKILLILPVFVFVKFYICYICQEKTTTTCHLFVLQIKNTVTCYLMCKLPVLICY